MSKNTKQKHRRQLTEGLGAVAALAALNSPVINQNSSGVGADIRIHNVQAENTELRSQLDQMGERLRELQEQATQAVEQGHGMRLNASDVQWTAWANRSPSQFTTKAFADLRASIAISGGNTQPGGVYKDKGGVWRVVFGHRRLECCRLENVPFLAVELVDVQDIAIFEAMHLENQLHEPLSVYEQGVSYAQAIEGALYASVEEMAKRGIFKSRQWIELCIAASEMPAEVVDCWENVTQITSKDVSALRPLLDNERERELVLLRAQLYNKAKKEGKVVAPKKVLLQLLHDDGEAALRVKAIKHKLTARSKTFCTFMRDQLGKPVLKFPSEFDEKDIAKIVAFSRTLAEAKPELKKAELPPKVKRPSKKKAVESAPENKA